MIETSSQSTLYFEKQVIGSCSLGLMWTLLQANESISSSVQKVVDQYKNISNENIKSNGDKKESTKYKIELRTKYHKSVAAESIRKCQPCILSDNL